MPVASRASSRASSTLLGLLPRRVVSPFGTPLGTPRPPVTRPVFAAVPSWAPATSSFSSSSRTSHPSLRWHRTEALGTPSAPTAGTTPDVATNVCDIDNAFASRHTLASLRCAARFATGAGAGSGSGGGRGGGEEAFPRGQKFDNTRGFDPDDLLAPLREKVEREMAELTVGRSPRVESSSPQELKAPPCILTLEPSTVRTLNLVSRLCFQNATGAAKLWPRRRSRWRWRTRRRRSV